MAEIRYIKKWIPIIVASLVVIPSFASAAWTEFLPRAYENHADVDFFASYEDDRNRVGSGGQDWSDAFVKEKLVLYSNGYSYHPRFISYQLMVSGALKQEDYNSSYFGGTGWRNVSGIEYDATVDVLPAHPYNLRLFSRRIEPLYKQMYATYINNVETSRGVFFRYRARPYFFRARYTEDSNESSGYSSDVKQFGVDGVYFKDFGDGNSFSLDAMYTHTNFDSSTQGSGSTDQYGVGNVIAWNPVTLTSNVSSNVQKQDYLPPQGSLQVDALSWYERLDARLPMNFKTDLTYTYNKTDITSGVAEAQPESSASSTDKRFGLNVTHDLYQSLTSRYAFLKTDISSSGKTDVSSSSGDLKSLNNNLSFNYRKNIPQGRLLMGLGLGRIETDISGGVSVVNELHTAVTVPGPFVLNVGNAAPATIQVYLKSPLPPFDLVLLAASVNYTVEPFNNTYQVTVVNLPSQFAVPGAYDFLASYSLVPSEYKSRTETRAYNVGFELFNNMVNPYYSYLHSQTEIVSGNYPGTPSDYTNHTLGVLFQKEPFRARAEYQHQESNVNPYNKWLGEVSYTKDVTDTTRVFFLTSFTDTDYFKGTSDAGGEARSTWEASVSGNLQQRLPAENLYLSLSGSYSRYSSSYSDISGSTDGSMYSADAALQWTIQKLTIRLGANVESTESESSGMLTTQNYNRFRQYYYLSLRRKIF